MILTHIVVQYTFRTRLFFTAGLSTLILTSPVQAQQKTAPAAEAEAGNLSDIVVTANRIEQRLQDVPFSIQAISGEELSRLNIHGVADLQNILPNVFVLPTNGKASVFIRGIGVTDTNPNAVGSVTIYNDNVALNSNVLHVGDYFDVERVEVLIGPQGTLYGRNVTGGAINTISRAPGGKYRNYVTGEFGSFNYKSIEGGVDVPFNETTTSRLSFSWRDRDGIQKNVAGPDFGTLNRYSIRYAVKNETEALGTWLLSAHYNRIDEIGLATARGAPGTDQSTISKEDAWTVNTVSYNQSLANPTTLSNIGGFLNGQVDLSFATLTSITGYEWAKHANISKSRSNATTTTNNTWGSAAQISQELRLASNGDGPFSWLIGGYGLHEALRATYDQTVENVTGSGWFTQPNPRTGSYLSHTKYRQTDDTLATFGQIGFDITPELNVHAGLRYTWEKIKFFTAQEGWWDAPHTELTQSKSFSPVTGSVGVDYKPSSDVLLYASFNRGARAGGFNANADTGVPPFGPEYVSAYEVGFKTEWFDKRLRLNADFFYTDYTDIQVLIRYIEAGRNLTVKSNAGSADIKGAELTGSFQVTPAFSILSNLGYLNTKYAKAPGVVGGAQLVGAPKWTWSAIAAYDKELRDGLHLYGRANWTKRTRTYLNTASTQWDDGDEIASAVVGLSFYNGAFSVEAFGNNLTNELVITAAGTDTVTNQPTFTVANPRSYGVRVSHRF